ncbi:sugar transferase [Apilactobacillus kunkeei]|uniref:Glycosyltransferase n=1 Tax=Apilactobacillus kunkeei DSM 12361 = ATCC 700308 TaxID=1423768 RepID=A0A0R1FL87_9LACO|nr:sugar transferase [Apilactobacillus kunkeei]KOY68368.1 Bacterial sugar transferase [Apilactobacillus kunkeei]KOY71927.1 Bacterial sugar transferase [Apilactobacillus kunkeei DSM 12361 = ATCC 700308]KPN81817.1 Bacterial sugar transferase [Apilactobacillus kunkeei]KRK22588.1 glycosyltransferase [Apilactobacillus kunkeei DSM 12361 = ATCC 700308]MCK8629115.1 sugar transferase [Apilactobacillus kunkeei]
MEKHSNIYSNFYLTVKRLFDIAASLFALLITLPLTLVVSLCIYLDDRGPIFYTQERIGKDGKPFRIYKFRSMCQNADAKKKELTEQNEVNGAMFKMSNDPRVTRVGCFIRRHSIDELPQLINVLLGNMTVVGPRPPLPEEVNQYSKHDKERLKVKPGCTGLWQVSGRNSLDFDEMVELDINYIEHASLLLDMKICFKTIWIMIYPNEAY